MKDINPWLALCSYMATTVYAAITMSGLPESFGISVLLAFGTIIGQTIAKWCVKKIKAWYIIIKEKNDKANKQP